MVKATVSLRLTEASFKDEQGLLVAAVDSQNSTAVVVGSVPVAAGKYAEAADAVGALLPQGLHVVGSYCSGSTPGWTPSSLPAGVPRISATHTAAGEGPSWSVDGAPQQGGLAAAAGLDTDDALQIAPGFVPIRVHVSAVLHIISAARPANGAAAADGNAAKQQPVPSAAAIQAAMQQLHSQLLSHPQQVVFVPDQLGTHAPAGAGKQQQQQQAQPFTAVTASSSSTTVQDLLASSSSSSGDPCLSLRLLQHSSSSAARTPPPAPMFEYTPSNSKQEQQLLSLPVTLDVLCYAPSSAALSDLHTLLLLPALQQQLQALQVRLQQQAAAGSPPVPLKVLHFTPPGLGFPVTLCYAVASGASPEAADAALLSTREQLHQLLGLPDNVPMLRLANALAWGAAAAGGEGAEGAAAAGRAVRLRNVHEGLTPPGFGGRVYLVDGVYDYYHYMQDKFNDAGWGCAYRSLQTIVSWFRLQHYTSKPVPSHKKIQEILVQLGDKPPSFIGSNQWIGAIELGFILDEYLGISHKVITVSQGADIPTNARALAQHFVQQGTPIMIGGGVLAYTLLGVAFNEDTGEAAFLILDPHYTGGEDLKKIQSGTWVAWKQLGDNAAAGGPLFVKDAFYNFLCPQRPSTV